MQLWPPTRIFSSSNPAYPIWTCTHEAQACMLPLLTVRNKVCFQHLIISINNNSHLNLVRHNCISPWGCCLFLVSHLWMSLKCSSAASLTTHMGNSQGDLCLPAHTQVSAKSVPVPRMPQWETCFVVPLHSARLYAHTAYVPYKQI